MMTTHLNTSTGVTPPEPPSQRILHGSHFRYNIEIFTHTDGTKWSRIVQEGYDGTPCGSIVVDQALGFGFVRALQDIGAAPPPPEPLRTRRSYPRICRSLRLRNVGADWTPEHESLLVSMYTDGAPLNELALCLGRDESDITKRLRKLAFDPVWDHKDLFTYDQQHVLNAL